MKYTGCVVVCVDGSESSWKAVEFARAFCSSFSSERLIAVHVIPTAAVLGGFMIDEDADMMGARFLEALEEQGKELVSRLEEQLPVAGVQIEVQVRRGNPASEIVNLAREQDADLIVLGNRGLTGIASVLLGSVGEKVVRSAPCSVMIHRA
ncbi:MAG: universal stress protein [Bacillota bacterium]